MRIHWRLSGLLLLVAAMFAIAVPLLPSSASVGSLTAAPAIRPAVALAGPLATERPAWHSLPLVDARSGQTFTLADFEGKTVYVEPMATWCTNCRQQMGIIRDQLLAQVDPERVVLLGLSVETDLAPVTLADYVNAQGFSWKFAVMTPDLLQALATRFGLTVTNPPAIPHFVISPDGTTSDLSTGLHNADELLGELTAAGGMAQ
jgi:cytochrome oxidase Cu insertion factor (SCO1/SenC/PrrC family)